MILLVDADMTKLKYEVVYRSEKEREKGFNFNRYWRNSKRIKMNENTVRATAFLNSYQLHTRLFFCASFPPGAL